MDDDFDRLFSRDLEREGPRPARRIPLDARGTLRMRFDPRCAGCNTLVASAEELSTSGYCGRCFVAAMAKAVTP